MITTQQVFIISIVAISIIVLFCVFLLDKLNIAWRDCARWKREWEDSERRLCDMRTEHGLSIKSRNDWRARAIALQEEKLANWKTQ